MKKAGGAVVGAFSMITAVGPKNVTTRLLKTYPDSIMQPIDPMTGLTPVRPASSIGSNYRMA
ncbi:hypothetical protein [Rhizobium sp. Leaf386]|uniref:hypothetical protein n=1 Tax=Rhizobium sp. Leaf386 TaxID=1736359 RepID=UPI0007122EC7|nr:hypothetical protein [Rhizobium sp. Leaf386]KQT04145.1 hypothetical protein ASG50_18270 [Rhizobium sp. Leaf386]